MKKYLQDAKKPDLKISRVHVCCPQVCNPENESTLKRRGRIPMTNSNITNDLLFICDYGVFHQCDPNVCMLNDVCIISGLSEGHIPEYKTYGPKKRLHVNTENITEIIETLVVKILYSDTRKKINEQWKRQQTKLCNKEKNQRIDDTLPVNLIALAMVQSEYDRKTLPLEILEYEQPRIDNYVQMITQVYEHVKRYQRDKICVESLTLGLLYKMKQGLKIDGVTIIPIDLYLVEHLPLMNNLPKFGIDKRKFTKGEKMINFFIEQARNSGVPLETLAIREQNIENVIVFKPTSRRKKMKI